MIINFLILFGLTICAFLNVQKTFLFVTVWLLPIAMFIMPPPFPRSLLSVLGIIIAICFYVKEKNIRQKKDTGFPFWIPALMYIASTGMTLIYNSQTEFVLYEIQKTFLNFIIPYLLWKSLNKNSDIQKIISYFLFYSVLLCMYSYYEALTNSNPIIEYLEKNELVNDSVEISERERWGIRRIQSFLAFNCTLCVNCSLWLIVLIAYKRNCYFNTNLLFFILICISLVLCTILTSTRSGIAGLAIALMSLIDRKLIEKKVNLLITIIGIIAFAYFAISNDYLTEVVLSFVETDRVAGSDTEMRMIQFGIAQFWLSRSLLFGNGTTFTFSHVANVNDGLHGAESIWIPLMIDKGILGIVAYISILIFVIVYGIREKNKYIVLVVLSYVVVGTLSSIPSVELTYFLIPVVILTKITIINNQNNGITVS